MSEDALPRGLTSEIRKDIGDEKWQDALWGAVHGIEVLDALVRSQQATIEKLEERLETYMQRSAPAISAARMHVPIGGGGSWSWRQTQARKAEKRAAAIEQFKLKEATRSEIEKQEDLKTFEALFKPDSPFSFGTGGDHSTQLDYEKPKKVQRKRAKRRK